MESHIPRVASQPWAVGGSHVVAKQCGPLRLISLSSEPRRFLSCTHILRFEPSRQLVGDLVVEDFADGDRDDDAGIDERAGFYHAGKMSEKGRSVKEEIGCPGRPARHFHGMTLGKLLASLSQQRDVCMNGYRPAGADSLVPVAAAAEFRRVLETGGDGTGIIAQQRALCRWGKDLPAALYLDPAREGGLEHRVWPAGPDILKVTYGGAYGRTVRRMRNGTLAFPVSLDEIGYL